MIVSGLSGNTRSTFRSHLIFIILTAIAEGILINAPMMALKGLDLYGKEWKLALQLIPTGFSMMLLIWITAVMAVRPKKHFLRWPGYLYAFLIMMMAFIGDPGVFLIILGLGYTAEVVSRPAVTMLIRINYPEKRRAYLAGTVRRWYYLFYIISGLASAAVLDSSGKYVRSVITAELILASFLLVAAFYVISNVKINENDEELKLQPVPGFFRAFRDAGKIFVNDLRFRKYLLISFLIAAGGLAASPFTAVLFNKELGFNYKETALFTAIIVQGVSVVTTGAMGKWFDRVNVWKASGFTRIITAICDLLLALSPAAAAFFPPGAYILPLMAALLKGIVRGGQWILWWQIAVNSFAKTHADTSRYSGMINFMNGIARIVGPLLGMLYMQFGNASMLFLLASCLVFIAALLSFREYKFEYGEKI